VFNQAVDQWKKRLGLCACMKVKGQIKPALFTVTISLPGKTRCYVSRYFRRSYLKANKVSKSGKTGKVEHAYNFYKCADAVYPKIIKISPCLTKIQLAKVGSFFETQCIIRTAQRLAVP